MNGARYIDYSGDESWGPKIDGLPYAPWYSCNKWDPDYAKQVPLVAHPDNVKDFYDIGVAYNTNVAISKAGEGYSTRFSFTNINRTGITPNSKQRKNFIGYNISVNPFSKLTVSSSLNASFTKLNAVPDEGYGQQTIGSFNQWFHRDIDMAKLKNYKNPDGTFTSWNIGGPRNPAPKYWDNPYTEVYENLNRSNASTLFANINATYNITKNWKAGFTAQGNYASNYADGRVASGTLVLANFNTRQRRERENTYIADLGYNNTFGNFSLKAAAYGEARYIRNEEITESTVGGLTIPGFYNIAASKDRPNVTNTLTEKETRSVYGYTSLGYKNMLYADLSLRNDVSSALPEDHNSYLYGSVSASFVFTELLKNRNILSFGRIRGSAGTVGSDVDPYRIHQVYNFNGFYGSTPTMTIPNQIPNEELKPAISHAYEAGAELRFLKDRIRTDFNYYDRKVTDQIISLTLPGSTGYTSALVNAGEIRNHGIEITLGGTIIKNKNITWDADFNVAKNINEINELYPGVSNFLFGSFGFSGSPAITANREVGQPFGTLIGLGFKRNANGDILVDDDGYPLTQDNVNFGSFLPDWTGGFTTMVNFKGFYAGLSMDFQVGGKYMSITNMFNAYSGLGIETAGLNENGKERRSDPSTGGGTLFAGIVESTGKPNIKYADTQGLYENVLFSLWENWIYDATFVKIREISMGYNLPTKWVSKIGGQSGSFSIITQNPWLIYADSKKIDPSQLEGTWNEGGQLPATKSLGFNLKIIF
jgi:outer membrane receptor protein involved in Fe transport